MVIGVALNEILSVVIAQYVFAVMVIGVVLNARRNC